MFTRGSSKERSSTRKVTPPSPSYMTNEQFGTPALPPAPTEMQLMARLLADPFGSRLSSRPTQQPYYAPSASSKA
jgi:hypothetical protein